MSEKKEIKNYQANEEKIDFSNFKMEKKMSIKV